MATKLYNSHLSKIILNCNEYYILDTYISLVNLSNDANGKYLIQSYSSSKSNLITLIKKHLNASYKTIYNCIDRLITMDILTYDHNLYGWVLVNMELMTKSKAENVNSIENTKDFTGYTHIRKFFFTEEFSNMKAREKRLIIYMAQLADSKSSSFHEGFSMNLLKPNSSWLKILKTHCKYYAKNTINNLFNKYKNLFEDNSDEFREKDLSPQKNKNFKFLFKCALIKDKTLDNDSLDILKITNPNEYAMVINKIKFANITLSNTKVMHIIKSISSLKEWFLKERIVQLIVNKYIAIQIHKSRDNIKSLPAYAAAVVRSVVNEYIDFKNHLNESKYNLREIEESFIDHVNITVNNNIFDSIKNSLTLI